MVVIGLWLSESRGHPTEGLPLNTGTTSRTTPILAPGPSFHTSTILKMAAEPATVGKLTVQCLRTSPAQ